jgi:hypothetical protein
MLYPVAARFLHAALLGLVGAGSAGAGGSLLPDGHLDTAAVRDAYLRSDMPFVRSELEAYIKSHPRDVSAAEKVFTHLYLGAAYAGEPGGRTRSEGHFRAALKFDAAADPSGLYLPPAARDWFESLRRDVRAAAGAPSAGTDPGTAGASAARGPASAPGANPGASDAPHPRPGPAGAAPGAPAASASAETRIDRGPRAWVWWAVGGGAAVAAGAGVFAWIQSRSEPEPRRVRVDATLE